MTNHVLLQDSLSGQWLHFNAPETVIVAHDLATVRTALAQVQQWTDAGGWAAGYISFEAAAAFDAALQTHPANGLPLVWFGLYNSATPLDTLPQSPQPFTLADWQPTTSRADYDAAIQSVHDAIARGDTYQVNYTMRLRSQFEGSGLALFEKLVSAQQAEYAAFIDTDEHLICSASPELFFTLEGNTLKSKPMKGTVARGMTWADDLAQRDWLHASVKNRAENVMIVDMIRNDMGRIAKSGSVRVPSLFDVEQYPTLHTMTSTVLAETDATYLEILDALFPCASITGAPKVSTMQLIHELETTPRGVYCGAIGYFGPNRQAQFNVAIRTVTVEKASGMAEYGTGGGIVWDSVAASEYDECFVKAKVLTTDRPKFALLETMLWEPDTGYFLFALHLDRLEKSAAYFAVNIDRAAIQAELTRTALRFTGPMRVRLLVSQQGAVEIQTFRLAATPETVAVQVCDVPIDKQHVFLYHKSTRRAVYEDTKALHPNCAEVILWNTDGEVTEATYSNVVIEKAGRLLTPPIASGLLGGTFRQHLLDTGQIQEQVITLTDLAEADQVFLINSVRRWRTATFIRDAVQEVIS